MTRNDKIQLIIEHKVNQWNNDSNDFVDYVRALLLADDDNLNEQLAYYENLISDMPENYGLGCSRN